MKGPEQLLEHEDHWVTRMGAWFPGERVVLRGKDIFHDLKDIPWMGLLLYGVTGRLFDQKQIHLFEGLWTICTSYPDPRLWNNRIVALGGTTRSTAALGIGSATAASEASIYGRRPDIRAIDFLYRTKKKLDSGADLDELVLSELKKYKGIFGYGRPITRKDERIGPIMALATDVGVANGFYIKLAFSIEKVLLVRRRRLHMNIAAVTAALAADQGLSSREYYHYTILAFSAGMLPCYLDAMNKPEGTFFPLRCNRILYEGAMHRRWEERASM